MFVRIDFGIELDNTDILNGVDLINFVGFLCIFHEK